MTNLQNSVRRLKIILASLLFLLIIRASIWRPYGKNLADPRYDQKDDQLQSTVKNLSIFVCTKFFGAFPQTDILELLL